MFSVAAILGPLWVGGSFHISCYLLFGVPLGLLVVVMVCFFYLYFSGCSDIYIYIYAVGAGYGNLITAVCKYS